MQTTTGRTALSVLAALAIITSLVTLYPVTPVSGGSGCPLNCSWPSGGTCLNSSVCSCTAPNRNPATGCTLCSDQGTPLNSSCSCFPCFSGSLCQTECGGNGECTATNSSGTCDCDPGFTGAQCGSCSACFSGPGCSIECSGNGTCMAGSCVCDPGFTGSQCQSTVPCGPGGCGNGTCFNNSCDCDPGYIGKNCTVAACSTDGDCDDGDPCTADLCDTDTGICDHVSDVAQCLSSFRCYKSGIERGQPKFVSPPNELETDVFDSKNTTIVKPAYFCAPVDRPGSPITNPNLGLECFKIKNVAGQAKFVQQNTSSTTDLGTDPLTLKSGKLVCLPAIFP